MAETSIEWCDKVWNPTRGCSRVNPDCDRCYAMGQARRSYKPGGAYEGLTTIRNLKVDWAGMARFIPDKLGEPLHWKRPARIFVNSMSDIFHPSLTNEEIAAVFGMMAACARHTFQLLTKRPKRMREWFGWADLEHSQTGIPIAERMRQLAVAVPGMGETRGSAALLSSLFGGERDTRWPLPNVHLGVSAGHQAAADAFLPDLMQTPAAVRWLSAEPQHEYLDVDTYLKPTLVAHDGERLQHPDSRVPSTGGTWDMTHLDWVVQGGESGYGAREFKLEWASQLAERCAEARVPYFFKQTGSYATRDRARLPRSLDGNDLDALRSVLFSAWRPMLRREFPRAA